MTDNLQDAQTPQQICTVGDVFLITGLGLVIVSGEARKDLTVPLRAGQEIELRCANGQRYLVTLASIPLIRFGTGPLEDRPRPLHIAGVKREQIAKGDTLWTAPHAAS